MSISLLRRSRPGHTHSGPTLSLNRGLVTLEVREPTLTATGIPMLIRSIRSTSQD
jgi:hypothetical protein